MTTSPATLKPTVLVTGAAHRIGRAIARDLGQHGWTVAVHYHRSDDAAQELVSEIHKAGGQAQCFAADLGNEQQTQDLIPAVTAALGPITAIINNASLFEYDDLATVSRESWDAHLNTNLRAPTVLTQNFVKQLPESQQGNIINIIDQRVWKLTPHFTSYTLSKAALWTLTQTAAQALAPRIRVNAIGPGPVLPSKRQSDAQFAQQTKAVPLQRATRLTEICETVRFILSNDAMTGQMIALDGGQHLNWQTPDVSGADE
ncbi:MAG: short chain dehydrogenase [Kordiimonas sp.]|nr:short chain dehydrogenase [Kordiimonas sp.]|tara:strand:+ start:2476 stop:3252 length:777 start_codon:yes stop_codon:yes gene_type:complete